MMVPNFWERLVAGALMIYLLAIALIGSANLLASFDSRPPTQASGQGGSQPATQAGSQAAAQSSDASAAGTVASKGVDTPCRPWLVTCYVHSENAKLLMQAGLAGIVGSILHAAQSLTSYVGNDTFKMSWTAWYVMRPWIGGILALAMALAAQAGLVGAGGGGTVNVFGITALGLLGGWFSKTTTDKLQEVFSTLFKTDADKERTDKLKGDQPVIKEVIPPSVPKTATEITIRGTGFITGAHVTIDDKAVDAMFISPTELKIDLAKLPARPTGRVLVVVTNPSGAKPKSETFLLTFE